MNLKTFNDIVSKQIDICKNILTSKGEEYVLDLNDRLKPFKQAADLQDITAKQALFGMLTKHIVSLSNMCSSTKEQSKAIWYEKITDSINYLILLRALVEDEIEK